jgi:hypothetical protein
MSARSFASLGLVALAFTATVPAVASSDGFVAINGEAGFQFVGGVPSMKSREEVRQEVLATPRAAWQLTEASPPPVPIGVRAGFSPTRDEVLHAAALAEQSRPFDGWRDLGGEAGWVFGK